MRRDQKLFDGYEQGPDYDRARSQIATPFQYIDIALDTAGVNQIYNVSGDFLYVDASSTGTITLELNNQYNDAAAPFQVSAGFGLEALFKQLKLSWSAQAGKKIRLMYSTGDRVVPTNSTSINGTVLVNPSGYSYGASYKSNTPMGANTPDTIISAASNVNGAILWTASFLAYAGGAYWSAAIIAKATAPTTVIDGDVLMMVNVPSVGAGNPGAGLLSQPVRVPAGKGVFYISTLAETGGIRSALYTLL